jgi:hypothetical protein
VVRNEHEFVFDPGVAQLVLKGLDHLEDPCARSVAEDDCG